MCSSRNGGNCLQVFCLREQIMKWILSVSVIFMLAGSAYSSPIALFDVQAGSNTQAGYAAVTSTAPVTQNGVTLAISNAPSWKDRGPIAVGHPLYGTANENLLRDTAAGNAFGSSAITATISGLTSGTQYDVLIWSYDALSSGMYDGFTSNWYDGAGAPLLLGYAIPFNTPDSANFTVRLTASAEGEVVIRGEGTQTAYPNCYAWISGVEVTPVPEPATMTFLALGACLPLLRRKRK